MNENHTSNLPEDDEINLLDILQVIAENARLLIFGPLLIGLAALGWTFTITPTYTATTSILPAQDSKVSTQLAQQLAASSGGSGISAADIGISREHYVHILKSNIIADHIIDRFNLMDAYESTNRIEARERLADHAQIDTAKKKEALITIAVEDSDPKRAAAIANAYVEELTKQASNLVLSEARQRQQLFKQEMVKLTQSKPSGANTDHISRNLESKHNEMMLEQLAWQYEFAKIDESREGAVIQVIDAAYPPERKSKPKKAQITTITALASGFVLLLFVFIRRALQNTGTNPENTAKLAAIRAGFVRVLRP